jgi:hypothetical protein
VGSPSQKSPKKAVPVQRKKRTFTKELSPPPFGTPDARNRKKDRKVRPTRDCKFLAISFPGLLWLLAFCCALAFVADLHAASQPVAPQAGPPVGLSVIQFKNVPVQAGPPEVKERLHCIENPGSLDPAKDAFQLLVPKNYRPEQRWGVLVWISPSDSARIPQEWEEVLAKHRLLFVGAMKAGNSRNILERIQLAVLASAGMRERFAVDERRVYVSGFSGGARVASMLGVAYADMFTGTASFMGVNFYTDLPSADGKKLYPPQYIPDDQVLEIAKRRSRFVLVSSERDFNKSDTRIVWEQGFKKEGFPAVAYMEVPGLGHSMPPAEWLEKALQFLDGPRTATIAGQSDRFPGQPGVVLR